ncbi:hypothetical protein [Mucilaginibacter gotjawali]|nr:hypothetical protein [Mucilaginibacter gotjawali]MBB3055591.1 hypothetical protein [Mucilaginibacter gotjawali]
MKKPLSVLLLFVLVICFFSEAIAQTTPAPAPQFAFRTDLIPPSPNAASLGVYGIVPVSLQTGIPDISIPITVAKGQQLSVPITLNYHGGGFKPSQEASWVGLNWSLDAGGVITRIIQDKIDEFMPPAGSYDNTNWRYTTRDSITQKFMDNAMYYFTNDTQPDVYSFNFAGHSGKFLIYKGKFYQFPYQQLTITGDPTNGFTIVTPEGNQYRFDIPETTIAPHNPSFDPNNPVYVLPTSYTSSWYLNTIHSADWKDVITFTYTSGNTISQDGPGTQNMSLLVQGYNVPILTPISFPFPTRIATLQLSSIITSKMTINFNTIGGRLDIPTYSLDNIQIYNYQGQLLDQFKFDVDYFSNGGSNNIYTTRLKLTGLEEGINPLHSKKYYFYYNNVTGWPSKKLPSVDHWGFWNGAYDISETGTLMPNTLYSMGVNREPVFQFAQAAMLNKIIYPTGGTSVFTYEPNIYNNGLNYVRLNKYNYDFINRLDTTSTDLVVNPVTYFTINYAQMVHVITSRIPKLAVTSGQLDPNGPNAATKDIAPEVVISLGSQSYPFKIATNSDNPQKTDSVFLQPGTYSMTVQCDAKENAVTGTVTYLQQTNQVIEGAAGPGIRIKSIVDYTDPECLHVATRKQYVYKDSVGESTGYLINTPKYGGRNYTDELHGASQGQGGTILYKYYTTYSSVNGYGQFLSQDMYYKKVYEQQIGNTDTLLSKSEFSLFDPLNFTGTSVFMTRKTDYKRVGNIYNILSQHDYNYSIVEDSSFSAVKMYLGIRRTNVCGCLLGMVVADSLRHWNYEDYSLNPSWLKLVSEKQYNYYNTSDTVTTTSVYAYDAMPRNRIWASVTDSKGAVHVEKYKYPESYEPGFASSLTDHAIYSPVLEKQTWLKRSATDSVLTNGIITQWDPALLRPTALYGFESVTPVSSLNAEAMDASGLYVNYMSDSRYKLRLSNGYDSGTGNLLWQDMTGNTGIKQINYLWGYHNNYPIAQVKNANPAAIAYTSFEDDDNSFTYTASGVTNADARTGVKCYSGTISKTGLPSGNYIFSLWGKGSGTITVGGVAKTMTSTWAFYQWQLTGITSISVNSNGNLIDEVRLFPVNALMTSYTYNPEVGVTSVADTRDMPQTYEYDDMQRLQNIKDKNGNIVKNFTYNYATQTAYWQDTGTLQCVQSGGVNTGEQQMQQKDLNPLSPTYNQYQWRSLGISSNCPVPVTVYVQMTVASAYTGSPNGLTQTYNTYAFKTFSDAACTLPFNVTADLVVNYQINSTIVFNDTTKPNSNTSSPATITITAGTHQATTAGIDVSGCSGSDIKGSCTTSTVVLQTGTGYVPEYPQI